MEDSTYKVIDIVGTSPDGVSAAMRSGVKRASETVRNLDWVEVTEIRAHLEGDEIAHFQVQMKVGFRLDDE